MAGLSHSCTKVSPLMKLVMAQQGLERRRASSAIGQPRSLFCFAPFAHIGTSVGVLTDGQRERNKYSCTTRLYVYVPTRVIDAAAAVTMDFWAVCTAPVVVAK